MYPMVESTIAKRNATRGCLVVVLANIPIAAMLVARKNSPKYEPMMLAKSRFHSGFPSSPITQTNDNVGKSDIAISEIAPKNFALMIWPSKSG